MPKDEEFFSREEFSNLRDLLQVIAGISPRRMDETCPFRNPDTAAEIRRFRLVVMLDTGWEIQSWLASTYIVPSVVS